MPSSVKKIGRTPPRYPPKPTFLEVSKDRTFSLKLRTPSQGVSILRFLFTKFYARGEVLTDTEVILLELLKIYFEELRNAPFGKQVLRDTQLMGTFALFRMWNTFHSTELPSWAKNQVDLLIRQYSMSPRAFLGFEKLFKVEDFIKSRNRKLATCPPPQRRIGVGYRDKGTAAIPHLDGTPSWQQVAVSGNPQTSKPYGKDEWDLVCKETAFRLLQPYKLCLSDSAGSHRGPDTALNR